jgi:hypothetical protein
MTEITRPHGGRNWTADETACQSLGMAAANLTLVKRRHVDFQRVRSAICL